MGRIQEETSHRPVWYRIEFIQGMGRGVEGVETEKGREREREREREAGAYHLEWASKPLLTEPGSNI